MSSLRLLTQTYRSYTKRQLFGIKPPTSGELTGLRKYFNSYTLQGRRNCVLATYGLFAVTAAAYWMHRQNKKEDEASSSMV